MSEQETVELLVAARSLITHVIEGHVFLSSVDKAIIDLVAKAAGKWTVRIDQDATHP